MRAGVALSVPAGAGAPGPNSGLRPQGAPPGLPRGAPSRPGAPASYSAAPDPPVRPERAPPTTRGGPFPVTLAHLTHSGEISGAPSAPSRTIDRIDPATEAAL
ncbi:hypothetical protein GCM10014713_43810 [Streptomyces purpureus]|uniref:Uncharacterized protein n=1 Tax=Streptomyces purpureus TaxID=1951 RepID=A0A918H8X7_9ACTN|nr:hypothetical protein GCM10014713_43810 [Streptomyces purpureus]